MTVITILISLACCAGLTYFFRVVDKQNNSMDKVRRYADKRLQDLGAYFDERQKQLNLAESNLKAEQGVANAAVKRLESQIGEFKSMIGSLENDSRSIEDIEAKIKSYDKVLNELVQMTANVEENLEGVKKASAVIDKISLKITENEKHIDSLEKHIPQVSAEFAQKNSEQLKALGTKLLEEYDLRSAKVEDELNKTCNQAKEAVSAFQEKIDSVYETASKKADALEDQAFKHLSEQAQARSNLYLKKAEENVADIDLKLQKRFEELETKYNQLLDSANE